jgi:uncharacterized protein (TIGR00159 family)
MNPMAEVLQYVSDIRFADFLDVLVVAVLLYVILRWLFQRTSIAVAVGLTLVLALYAAARYLSMYLTLAVFRGGAVLIVIVLAIVFQDDIRRGLERLAAWRPGRMNGVPHPLHEVKATIVEAAAHLAERGLGALIVLAGRDPLEAHVRGGIKLDGRPSLPLLLSIFDHKTPGHDGAVVLQGPVLSHFAVHLPLSKNLAELGGRGTRHAAALGLSEWCDAMIIIVSEEQGTISVAERGALSQLECPAELQTRMEAFYTRHEDELAGKKTRGRVTDWSLKAASLAAACLLWGVFAFRLDQVERVFEDVPVEYRNLPAGWQVDHSDPAAVQVRLSGPERAFDQLNPATLRISLGVGDYQLKLGRQEIEVPSEALKLPPGLDLAPGDPPMIELVLERIVTLESTVKPRLVGKPPGGHRVGGVSAAPQKVRITVPSRFVQRARTLDTAPISLEDAQQSFTREVALDLPPGGAIIGRPNNLVSVAVEIVGSEEDSG